MPFIEKPFSASKKMETEAKSNENIKTTDQFAEQFIELEPLNDEIYSQIEELKKGIERRTEIRVVSKKEREINREIDKLLYKIGKKLEFLFEEQSEAIIAIELFDGGDDEQSAIKFFPGGQILERIVQRDKYDEVDETEYRFCDFERAKGLLQESIDNDNQRIKELTERKNTAEKTLEELP